MSFLPINNALSSINLINRQIDLVSNNISNASTEGYTRKQLPQYSQLTGNDPRGVTAGLVQRQVDSVLQRDLFTQTANSKSLEVAQRYHNQLQNFHRPPEENQSITAEIGQLKDAFISLSNEPSSGPLLDVTLAQAEYVSDRINSYSALLSEMRNDAQNEASLIVNDINTMLKNIRELNVSIKTEFQQNRSTAALEDQRDILMAELSQEIEIDYFEDENKVVQVMTRRGRVLVDTDERQLVFNPEPIGPRTFYPDSVSGIYIDNADTGYDLASQPNLGGRLGALLDLRDNALPQYGAQLDELAHKMASRFDEAGLRLFSDQTGAIPANDPEVYAGFAASIKVNPSVVQDKSLLRTGTTGATVQDGSPEFLRRIVENTFGEKTQLEALGNVDISGVGDLFTTLGIDQEARFIGGKNIESLNILIDSSPYLVAGTEDTFNIQIGAGLAQDIQILPGETASDLVNTINTAFPGLASLGPSGQIVFSTNESITIGTTNISPLGIEELGLELGTTAPNTPSFSIVVGIDDAIDIPILPTDTGADLVAKINSLVPKVTAGLDVNGFLQITPDDGGDIAFLEGLNNPVAALGLDVSSRDHVPFNNDNLGPGSNLAGRISSARTLQEYSEFMITAQSMDAAAIASDYEFEESYRQTIQSQVTNLSGVNLDEEMASLIQLQTSYSASTQVIETFNRMLDDLFSVFR